MANFIPGNNKNIYQLLSQHNFTFINQKIDDYKCIICHRILINAHQAYCGCNYCEKCVDEQVRSNVVFCPGDTEECKTAALSNVFPDPKTNKQILQLVVKCPEEMCCFESQLRNMGDHLRLCGKRSVECPFTDFGCDQGKLKTHELNEHLQQESYRHSEILIGVIGNLRNELAELKRDKEKCNAAIDKLVKSDIEKGVIIDAMKEEIESIKSEKAVLEQRVDNLGNILGGKVDKMMAEIETKLEEMKREWRGAIGPQQLVLANVEEKNEVKYRTKITERNNSVRKCLAESADFLWTIDNISEERHKRGWLYSEHFNGCSEPYKMQLRSYFDGNKLKIYFYIDSGDRDKSLLWPFERNIKIAITNQKRPNSRKTVTQQCTILKPSNNIFNIQSSAVFEFKWNELSNDGLMHGNNLIVQCFIRDE